MAHGEVYDAEFGWNTDFEALVARIVADYDPQQEAAWIAELDGRRVGCVFCVTDPADPGAAKLRILLVHPDGRGHGLGGRLVDTCLDFARAAGYERMRLWTNHPLEAARKIYLARGFQLTHEEPHDSFGVDLVGQTYEVDLRDRAGASSETPTANQTGRGAEPGKPSSSAMNAPRTRPPTPTSSVRSRASSPPRTHRSSAVAALHDRTSPLRVRSYDLKRA